jgi:hypothetical protein
MMPVAGSSSTPAAVAAVAGVRWMIAATWRRSAATVLVRASRSSPRFHSPAGHRRRMKTKLRTPPHALVSREPTSLNPPCITDLALRWRAVVIPASGMFAASAKGFPTGHLLREALYGAPEGKGNEAASRQSLPGSLMA